MLQLKEQNNIVVELCHTDFHVPYNNIYREYSSLNYGISPLISTDRTETFRYGSPNNRLTKCKEDIDFEEVFNINLLVICHHKDSFFNENQTNTVESVSYRTKLNPSLYTKFERKPLVYLDEEDMIEQGIDISNDSYFFTDVRWDYEKIYNDFPEFKQLVDIATERVFNSYHYKDTVITLKKGERTHKYEPFIYYDEYLKCDEYTNFSGNYGENNDLVHVCLQESYTLVRNKVESPYNYLIKALNEHKTYEQSFDKQESLIQQVIRTLNENWLYNRPYMLILSGNDDTSYSKSYHNIEAAIDELKYLTALQPINMTKDVLNRGYIFTN